MIRRVKLVEVKPGVQFFMVTMGVKRRITITSKPIRLSLGYRVTFATLIGNGEIYENHFYLEEFGISNTGPIINKDEVNGLFFTEEEADRFIAETINLVSRYRIKTGDNINTGDFSITLKG